MYAASKSALEAAVRVLTKKLAATRIRINAIKPGIVDTEMKRRWMSKIGLADVVDFADVFKFSITEVPKLSKDFKNDFGIDY
jgi:NAD(P)-dependent dehydrogenase (short-subunit alcohol dehydrogenase family)